MRERGVFETQLDSITAKLALNVTMRFFMLSEQTMWVGVCSRENEGLPFAQNGPPTLTSAPLDLSQATSHL